MGLDWRRSSPKSTPIRLERHWFVVVGIRMTLEGAELLRGNAVRFLGLAKENGAKRNNRQRLEQFRAKHNLDRSIFKKIDEMTA